jgi:PAS domain-containing protein
MGLLHAIYDLAPIGITLTDPQGRFVRANPALSKDDRF